MYGASGAGEQRQDIGGGGHTAAKSSKRETGVCILLWLGVTAGWLGR